MARQCPDQPLLWSACSQSTCFGCRPLHHLGKRSASPEPHGVLPVVPGVAVHPGRATSYVGPTTYGLPHYLGKRSAEPYGGYGKRSAEPHGLGVAAHPGYATSYVGSTVYGYPRLHYRGKRSADADADAHYGLYGYGGYGYGYGVPGGYTRVSSAVPFGYNYGLAPFYG